MERLNAKSNTSTVGYLMVKVWEARGLANTDIIGQSDPFCVIRLNNDRFVTQTDCNNLSPSWGKVFQFTNITDICDVLEITVYDENYDHKYDLLGRLKIPLLRIQNNTKRWYALKGKYLRSHARGVHPRILLEMYFIYSKPLALLTLMKSPRQEIYHQEIPNRINSPTHSVNRIKAVTTKGINFETLIGLFKKTNTRKKTSFMGIYISILISIYFFELWMIPLGLAIPFAMNVILSEDKSPANVAYDCPESIDDEEEKEEDLGQDEIDDAVKSVPWLKVVNERMHQMQEMKFTVQLGLDMLANELESIQNLYNFSCPLLSWMAFGGLIFLTVLLKYISIRHLLMAFIIKKIVWSFLEWHAFGMIDLVSFMSRVPDNEELEDYQELKVDINGCRTPKSGQCGNTANHPEHYILPPALNDETEDSNIKSCQMAPIDESAISDKQDHKIIERKRVRTSMEEMRGLVSAIAHITDKKN